LLCRLRTPTAQPPLAGRDLKAINTFDQPNNVVPRNLDAPQVGSSMTFRLPAGSYTVAHLATTG